MSSSLWDEIGSDKSDMGLVIQWFGVPCLCRCRHCSLRNTGNVTAVPFSRARALADRFVLWKREQGIADFSIDIIVGYSCDHPELAKVVAFNAANGVTSSFAPVKGTRFLSEHELRREFSRLRDIGISNVGLTFFGQRKRHDRFCGRKGDYDYTMKVAHLAAECGLERRESIILGCDAVSEVPELTGVLDDIPGTKGRDIGTWDYRGRAKLLEDERPTIGDVESLPTDLRQYLSPACTSEAEWIRRIGAGDYPRKKRRVYLITVSEETVSDLETRDCGRVLSDIRDTNEAFLRSIPSMYDLASLYGNATGEGYYRVRDLEWKWIDLYLDAHPDVSRAGRFDDIDTVVLWHT